MEPAPQRTEEALLGEWVEIEDWQREVKAVFPSEESARAVVPEALEHIKRTGRPDTFRLHTHSPPPRDAQVIYLKEFDLLPKYTKLKHFAPCPVCSPDHRKYGEGGIIAYFPAERVIRIIGPDCFATYNAEGHEEAYRQMRRRQQVEDDNQYLLDRYHFVPELIDVIDDAIPAAVAFDRFRRQLKDALKETAGLDMWDHVRDEGALRLETTRTEHFRRADGSEGSREVAAHTVYGNLATYTFFAPRHTNFSRRLEALSDGLSAVYDAGHDVQLFDDDKKMRVASLLRRSFTAAHALFSELDAQRRFIDNSDIPTINGWARSKGSPIRLVILKRLGGFHVGRDTHNGRIVQVGTDYHHVLRPLPQVAVNLAAE
jgi:hypothetical protein